MVLEVCSEFVEQLFEHIIGTDNATIQAISANCVDEFMDEKRVALEAKLQELLRPYTTGYGFPLETEFRRKVSRTAIRRVADQLSNLMMEEHYEAFEEKPKRGLSRKQVIQTILNAEDFEGTEFGEDKVIHMMVAYYYVSIGRAIYLVLECAKRWQMSRRTFTENLINLAVESVSCVTYRRS
jgi:hypothetical protein